MTDVITQDALLWGMGAAVGIIVWAVRVEAKVQAHDREIERMGRASDQFRLEMRADLKEVKDALQYIRERLDER